MDTPEMDPQNPAPADDNADESGNGLETLLDTFANSLEGGVDDDENDTEAGTETADETAEEVDPDADASEGTDDDTTDGDDDETPTDDDAEDEGDDTEEAEGAEEAPEATDEDEPSNPLLTQTVQVKVLGEEMEVPVSQLIKDYELRSASHKRMEEAAETVKAVQGKAQFADTFNSYFEPTNEDGTPIKDPAVVNERRATLFAHLVEQMDDPMPVISAQIMRAAALGKLPDEWATALGVDPQRQLQYSREYQEELRKRQVAAQQAPEPTGPSPQEVQVLAAQIEGILTDADLMDADESKQREYVQAVFEYGQQNGISDPARAHLRYQKAQQDLARKQQELVRKAVKKTSPGKQTAASLASGKPKPRPGDPAPSFETEEDMAKAAVDRFWNT